MTDEKPDKAGGPTPRRPSKRLDAILAAATEEFAAKGFALARLDDVARRARVAKGTIYLYFDSKEDLFHAVAQRSVVPLIADVADRIDRFDGPSEALLRLIVARLRQGLADPDIRAVIHLVVSEAGRFPDLAEFYYREVISRGIAAIRKVIARGVSRGEFRPNAIERFPQLVVAPAMLGLVWQELFARFEPLDLDGLLDAHIDILLHGIGGPET